MKNAKNIFKDMTDTYILAIGGSDCDGVDLSILIGDKEKALQFMKHEMIDEASNEIEDYDYKKDQHMEYGDIQPIVNFNGTDYGYTVFSDHHTDYKLAKITDICAYDLND